MAELFNSSRVNVAEHINNVFSEGELSVDNLNRKVIYTINYKDIKKAILELRKDLMEKNVIK